MDIVSANAFWRMKHGFVQNFPTLNEENLKCDVLVVGGGISGALMSYELVQRGFSTILLERYDVGAGSTSGSTALVQYELDLGLKQLSERIGVPSAIKAYQSCFAALEKIQDVAIDISFPYIQKRKSFYFARTESDLDSLQEEVRVRREIDPSVQFVDHSTIAKHFSFSRPGALVTNFALEIDPYLFTHRLLKECEERGLRIFDRTEFQSFTSSGQTVCAHVHPGHEIHAKHLVFAVGYEAAKYLPEDLFQMNASYAVASKPIKSFEGWYEKALLWEMGHPYLYLRTTGDNRAIIGGLDEPLITADKRDELIVKKSHQLTETFQKMFPQIQFVPAYSWAGSFVETTDSMPYIGHLDCTTNVHFLCGFGGNGIVFSTIASHLICDQIQGRKSDLHSIFGFVRH